MINSTLLWGAFFIVLGISIMVKAIFGIDLPILRLAFALFLIYFGFSIITGGKIGYSMSSWKTCSYDKQSYSSVFNTQDIDLTNEMSNDELKTIAIKTVFGSSRVRLNPDVPTEIRIETVFGNVQLPDGKNVTFGNVVYETHPGVEPKIILKIDTVFGQVQFI